jgi:hypothetical protein
MGWILGGLGLLITIHVVVPEVTIRTPYSICLSKLSVYGPEQRDRIVRSHSARLLAQAGLPPDVRLQLTKDAGEFKLGYNKYMQSGTIWAIQALSETPPGSRSMGFFTNCGEVLSEAEYFDRY